MKTPSQRVQRLLAYLVVVALAMLGVFQSTRASNLAHEVDIKAATRACIQNNGNIRDSNAKTEALRDTAKLTVNALAVIATTPGVNSAEVNGKLNELARQARKVQINFPPAKEIDCGKALQARSSTHG